MKRLFRHIAFLFFCACFASCVTNNGDIGGYYGTWALDEVSVNGVVNHSWDADDTWTNWSFQNNIVCIARCNVLGDQTRAWGTWSESDGCLFLDYTHRDDGAQYQQSTYWAPQWIFFSPDAVNVLSIVARSGSGMTLSLVNASGDTIVYKLRKTY